MWNRLTHFVSIPCTGENFRDGFHSFKTRVLEENTKETVAESLFQNPNKLHLTLGVMTLDDDKSKLLAIETLNDCKESVIRPLLKENKLKIQMSGVDIFKKNLSKARVLYGKVVCPTDELILQQLANSVRRCFVDKGLMSGSDQVTLHVTLMNAQFRIRKERKNKMKSSTTFDATDILQGFAEYDFGVDELSGIEISHFGLYGDNGYYKPLSSITIP
uniref:Activating signal cointegrator 1 complex subunit 1 n=1 Tax=Lygus hesperus TaxID=30085 RepID=A0A0A9WKJ7_LYGHE